jgi:hypothetical protein
MDHDRGPLNDGKYKIPGEPRGVSSATQYLANSQNSYVGVLWMLVNRSEFLFIR